jgi:hypothetical protein
MTLKRMPVCRHGHTMTPANTYWRTDRRGAYRICRTCKQIKDRRNWALGKRKRGGESDHPIPKCRVPDEAFQARPPIVRVYEGQEFLVVWNGA